MHNCFFVFQMQCFLRFLFLCLYFCVVFLYFCVFVLAPACTGLHQLHQSRAQCTNVEQSGECQGKQRHLQCREPPITFSSGQDWQKMDLAFSFWTILKKSLAIFLSGLWNYGSSKGLLHPHRIKRHTNTSASPALSFCEKVRQSCTRHSQESSKSPNYYDYVYIYQHQDALGYLASQLIGDRKDVDLKLALKVRFFQQLLIDVN